MIEHDLYVLYDGHFQKHFARGKVNLTRYSDDEIYPNTQYLRTNLYEENYWLHETQ